MKRQTVDDRLLAQIERMTPAQRAAQLFMVAPDPTDDPEAVAECNRLGLARLREGRRGTIEAKVADFESSILEANDEPSLLRIGEDIAKSNVPPRLRTRIRNTYSARLREVRAPK